MNKIVLDVLDEDVEFLLINIGNLVRERDEALSKYEALVVRVFGHDGDGWREQVREMRAKNEQLRLERDEARASCSEVKTYAAKVSHGNAKLRAALEKIREWEPQTHAAEIALGALRAAGLGEGT